MNPAKNSLNSIVEPICRMIPLIANLKRHLVLTLAARGASTPPFFLCEAIAIWVGGRFLGVTAHCEVCFLRHGGLHSQETF